MFRRVLVANRGVAACRILRRMGIGSVAVRSEADRHALHVAAADQARCVGPAAAGESYLRIGRVLQAAREAGADAVHPGYGFLAENAEFAQACADAGLAFIGPTPAHIRDFGLKHRAREIARAAGVRLSPNSGLLPDLDAARRLGEAVAYANAGTVEFIYDPAAEAACFLEVNARLQVEHGVTEAVLGIDRVEWMLRQAAGEGIPPLPPAPAHRHAIEARLYAEDPGNAFCPAAGRLTRVRFPDTARIDSCVAGGTEVSPFYDPMLATVIVAAEDRPAALRALAAALDAIRLEGIEANLSYLRHLLHGGALAGQVTTSTLADTEYSPPQIAVLSPGTQTAVQDWPGRLSSWHVGVPPSGPMDDRSFRLGNRAVGNPEEAAGLEIVVSGPSPRFDCDAAACLSGAALPATLDGAAVPYWEPVAIRRGGMLAIGAGAPAGSRTYLAICGGLDVPDYLGAKSTFTLGAFGRHRGRALLAGDVLRPGAEAVSAPVAVPEADRPAIGAAWEIGVLDGPRAGPGRRVPGRPGRSAAPAGHHQVQPRPYLDAGERGRHRRRLPVRLWHGGAGRLPVHGPHLPGLEQPSRHARVRAGPSLAAALLRPPPLP